MEEECHLLDLKVSQPTSTCSSSSTFDHYLQLKSTIKSLEEEKTTLENEIQQAQQVLIVLLLTSQDPQNNRMVQDVANLMKQNIEKITSIVSKYTTTLSVHIPNWIY